MKKLITLGLSLAALTSQVFGYNYCCQESCLDNCCPSPSCCYYPCDDFCNECGFGGCCRPGFYIGGEAGYAWIKTPTCDCPDNCVLLSEYENIEVDSHRGHFAWGVFAGYNRRICNSCFFLGLEGGYNDNGFSKLCFRAHDPIFESKTASHRLKLYSRDWNISATLNYCFCQSFNLFVKAGGARVRESFGVEKHGSCEDQYYQNQEIDNLFCRNSQTRWAGVVKAGVGYSIFDCVNIYVAYRGLFTKSCDHFEDHFENVSCGYYPEYRLKNCSRVDSVYGGLVFIF
jgi:opacity protein-like surface antigen